MTGSVLTLNEVYSSLSSRRRYEVWFLRLGLADGNGAWWFRYLLLNPGRQGCAESPSGQPVQVWATCFPREGKPQSFIQGFSREGLDISARCRSPFHFRVAQNAIDENSCRGFIDQDGHRVQWNLRYSSRFRVTLSDKGWIGFSRTPHSDAVFSGEITIDDKRFAGEPLGFGLQGHNCGYRHRNFWTWAQAVFTGSGRIDSFEALTYEMPFGLMFRKAVLWREGKACVFRDLRETVRDQGNLQWNFHASNKDGLQVEVAFDGHGSTIHRLPYLKTDCSSTFEVANNSLAKATIQLVKADKSVVYLETDSGAVLEMVGD